MEEIDTIGSILPTPIVIPNLKIAVEWNGKWHYEKLKGKHDLNTVKNRDKLKKNIITEKYKFTLYVIKDMGKHNPQFVREQFNKFIQECV